MYPQSMFLGKSVKIYFKTIFFLIFIAKINSCILHVQVFVMLVTI